MYEITLLITTAIGCISTGILWTAWKSEKRLRMDTERLHLIAKTRIRILERRIESLEVIKGKYLAFINDSTNER